MFKVEKEPASEVRRNPLNGSWVVMSSQRLRPPPQRPDRVPDGFCPFCPGNEASTPPPIAAFPDRSSWITRVIPNRRPALRIETPLSRRAEGFHDVVSAMGAHEVIVVGQSHRPKWRESSALFGHALRMLRNRINDLKGDTRLASFSVFASHDPYSVGAAAHPHLQLLATPFIAPALQAELERSRTHFLRHERVLAADLLQQELREGDRLVYDSGAVVGFAPFASRFPFEVWLLPTHHSPRIEAADDALISELACALQDVLSRLSCVLGAWPFDLVLHTSPVGTDADAHFRWRLEIIPLIGPRGSGYELASGCYINTVFPKIAASALRGANLD